MGKAVCYLLAIGLILVLAISVIQKNESLTEAREEIASKEEEIATNYYSLVTKITRVNYNDNIVECEDFNGNIWSFYDCEDWEVGDCAGLLMDSKGTDLIYDDEIISANYCGWNLLRWD